MMSSMRRFLAGGNAAALPITACKRKSYNRTVIMAVATGL